MNVKKKTKETLFIRSALIWLWTLLSFSILIFQSPYSFPYRPLSSGIEALALFPGIWLHYFILTFSDILMNLGLVSYLKIVHLIFISIFASFFFIFLGIFGSIISMKILDDELKLRINIYAIMVFFLILLTYSAHTVVVSSYEDQNFKIEIQEIANDDNESKLIKTVKNLNCISPKILDNYWQLSCINGEVLDHYIQRMQKNKHIWVSAQLAYTSYVVRMDKYTIEDKRRGRVFIYCNNYTNLGKTFYNVSVVISEFYYEEFQGFNDKHSFKYLQKAVFDKNNNFLCLINKRVELKLGF